MALKPTIEELDLPEMAAVRGGTCPASILTELKAALQVSDLELAAVLGIPRQTMLRRLQAGTLKRHEADRAVALAKAYNKALEFFGYKHETAVQWMKLPNPGLEGETPLERADTVTGANDVVVLIHRIEHGIAL